MASAIASAGPIEEVPVKNRLPSFRLRIALLSAGISGLVLIATGIVAWLWLSQEKMDSIDREIRALAYRHPGWMNNRSNYERIASAIEFIFGQDERSHLVLAALDTRGQVRFKSAHWPEEISPSSLNLDLQDTDSPTASHESAPPPKSGGPPWAGGRHGRGPAAGRAGNSAVDTDLFTKVPRFLTATTSQTTWRLGILGNAEDRLVVGLDCSDRFAELARLRNGFLLALAPALALIAMGGWMVAGRAVRPLRVIAQAAEQMTAQGLDQRIPASTDDPEIQRLTTVLNRMMDRLQASFQQATRFSADASHELKTPLAVMQAELEQGLQNAADGSRDQQVYSSLLEETHRLARITRSLLLLARADSGRLALTPADFDLSEDLDLIVMDARILAEADEVRIESSIPPNIRVHADRVLLRQAIANLLDNAVHYNRPGGIVEIRLDSTSAGIELTVANTGPGIPPEDQSRIFDRFHRGAEARAKRGSGTGLGLSLAREIVTAHRGALILAESTAARTVFRLSLPTSQPDLAKSSSAVSCNLGGPKQL